MKKYLIISLAALVAACACTKVEPNEVNEAINFQVVNYASATKAEPATLDANTDFGVFAYYNTTLWATATATTDNAYIPGVQVLHQTDGSWATNKPYYWPKTGYLTFAGWSPYAQTATFDKAKGIMWTDWTITPAPGATNKVDLMYTVTADEEGQAVDLQGAKNNKYGHTGVPMLFHHALAKLNFKAEYDMTDLTDAQKAMFKIKVTNITLKALGNKASFANSVWATPSASADQKVADASDELTSTAATDADYVENYFIIPQTPVSLVVNYTINGIACDAVTLALATEAIPDWVENHVYTYTLKISPISDDKITFDPSVAAWATAVTDTIDVE